MIKYSGQKQNGNESPFLKGAVFVFCLLLLTGCHRSFHPQGVYVEEALFERTGAAVAVRETLAFRAWEPCLPDTLLNKPLDAESAAQIALLNNPFLKSEMMGIGIKGADVESAMLLPNPSLALSLFFPDRSGLDTGVEAGITYKIVDLLLLPYRTRAAKEAYCSEQLRVLKEALKLIGEVQEAFYTLQEAQALVKAAAMIKEAAEIKFMLAAKLHEEGNIGDTVFFDAETEVWQAKEDEAASKIYWEGSQSKLAILLGVSQSALSINEESVESAPPHISDEIDTAAGNRVEIALLNHELRRFYSMRPIYSPLSYTFSTLGINFKHDPEKYNAAGPSAGLEIPLFNSGQSDRHRLDYEIGALHFQRQMAWIRAKGELAASIQKYKTAQEKFSFASERAESAKSIFLSDLSLYNVMNISPLALMDAKKRELEAYVRQTQTKAEAMREAVRLKRAMQISLND